MATLDSLTSLGSGCSETRRGSCQSPKARSQKLARYHSHYILLVTAEPTENCGWERETERRESKYMEMKGITSESSLFGGKVIFPFVDQEII